jgi:hypothetical protein
MRSVVSTVLIACVLSRVAVMMVLSNSELK